MLLKYSKIFFVFVCFYVVNPVFFSLFLLHLYLASTLSSNQKNVRSGVTALSSTSSSFGNVVTNGRLDSNSIDEHLKQQLLAEEEAAMNQFKVRNYLFYETINFIIKNRIITLIKLNIFERNSFVNLF